MHKSMYATNTRHRVTHRALPVIGVKKIRDRRDGVGDGRPI